MPHTLVPFQLIEDEKALQEFYEKNKTVEWMCFDTEFVGEKRFLTLLCLIQIATEHGFFLIDPLKVKDIGLFLKMVEDPAIEKITHAGENDYRLLNMHYQTVPKNVFDTQVAAGFAGYKYPISFGRLLECELRIRLKKGYAVTDWEGRPFAEKQLRYALNDVKFLYDLAWNLKEKLGKQNRLEWAQEEFREMENAGYYLQNPNKEVLNSNLIRNLRPKEKVFLLRLYKWRTEEARRKNYSREMILPSKLISHIVRNVASGLDALRRNRRLPNKMVERYGKTFVEFYQQPVSPEEQEILNQIQPEQGENPQQDLILEMLHLLIRYKCYESQISPNLVLPRNMLKKLKNDPDYFDPALEGGWRPQFLGEELIEWLEHRHDLEIDFGNGHFKLSLRKPGS